MKQIEGQERQRRKAQRRASEDAYRDFNARERTGNVVPLGQLNRFGDELTPAPSREGAKPDLTPARRTPVDKASDGTEASADAPPRDEQDWAIILVTLLREVKAVLPHLDPATTSPETRSALREEWVPVDKNIGRFLNPTRHRIKQLRWHSAHG